MGLLNSTTTSPVDTKSPVTDTPQTVEHLGPPPEYTYLPPAYDKSPPKMEEKKHETLEQGPLLVLITTYLSYFILICFGHVRDFFGKRFRPKDYKHLMHQKVGFFF